MITARGGTLEVTGLKVSGARVGAKRVPTSALQVEARARELITMAAHDLRSPLASIRFRAYAIVERWRAGQMPSAEEWASVVVGASAAAEDAAHMIDDLLTMERLDRNGGRARRPAVVDVQDVIGKAIDREKLALERARCRVTVLRRKGLASARGAWDRPYLLRVFGNLLRNAAHHAAGAPILITLARRGDRLGIVFSDRGPGLPAAGGPAEISNDRRDESRGDAETHGLGLWIVRRAVHRLQGRLRIDSRAGVGVTFDVELPGLER
jgi:signal transduction histidine kinase